MFDLPGTAVLFDSLRLVGYSLLLHGHGDERLNLYAAEGANRVDRGLPDSSRACVRNACSIPATTFLSRRSVTSTRLQARAGAQNSIALPDRFPNGNVRSSR